jgi:hypothetical protein
MKKQDFNGVFATENGVPDFGPIGDYVDLIATANQMPDRAIVMCTVRIEEAAPLLRAVLVKAADGKILSEQEETLLFRGLHILGAARDTETCQPLLRLLHRPEADLDLLLGDTITESLTKIVAGVFDGNADALFDAMANPSIDGFIREALIGAATFLTWKSLIPLDRMEGFLRRVDEEKLAPDGDPVWSGWMMAIALLGLRDWMPLVRQAFDEGRIDPQVYDKVYFEEQLSKAEAAPDDIGRFERADLGYIEDVLSGLEWVSGWHGFADLDDDLGSIPDFPAPSQMPVTNPWRHVGRNDPCPCGSGKKAKKCCLGR